MKEHGLIFINVVFGHVSGTRMISEDLRSVDSSLVMVREVSKEPIKQLESSLMLAEVNVQSTICRTLKNNRVQ